MSLVVKLLGIEVGLNQTRIQVQITPSGNYPAGGDTVDLTPLIGQAAGGVPVFAANNAPLNGDVSFSGAGGAGAEFIGSFIPGAQLNNGKLKILVTTSGNELGAGAYPATLLNDANIQAEFIFNKNL